MFLLRYDFMLLHVHRETPGDIAPVYKGSKAL